MAIKKSDLYSSLWASCDELRGGMDASQYKDYVLTLLFVKYVSDKYANKPMSLIEVPQGASFEDMVALKGKPDIGEKIMTQILTPLFAANGLEGSFELADFNDDDKLGSGKEKVDLLSKLVAIFQNPALDFKNNRAEDDDILGDAYEYLMRHFATESGKSKGQFYTPAEVSRILAHIINVERADTPSFTAYDPTCGSGSLLLKVAETSPRGLTMYGQEKDIATKGLAIMNMWLHGYPEATIAGQNTIASPQFKESENQLKRFDFVVANPPFSVKNWSNGIIPRDDAFSRFRGYGIPPDKNGDYAFLLHIIASLNSKGKGAVILPHGVLFRGGSEGEIRRNLIERKLIKGIIGLPANLFYGTGIPACIIVVDKENKDSRDGIFMIDASKGYKKDGNKNRLREQDIHLIVDVFNKQIELDKYARLVPWDEIAGNEYNLNIPRYINTQEEEDIQDLDAHLNGGIPNRDVDGLARFWDVYPSLKAELFETLRSGYSQLKVEHSAIKETIFNHAEFIAYRKQLDELFVNWSRDVYSKLEGIHQETSPKELVSEIAEQLLEEYKGKALIDRYTIYQHLMDYWGETMKDDVYIVIEEGWKARTRRILEKNKRGNEVDKGWVCDLLPKHYIVDAYFADERDELATQQAELEQVQAEIASAQEEHAVEGGLLEDATTDAGKLTKSSLTKQMKQVKADPEEREAYALMLQVEKLFVKEAKLKSQIKALDQQLDVNAYKKYPQLSAEEVKGLVIDNKWLAALKNDIDSEIDGISQRLTTRVKELAERYAETMPQLTEEVKELESKVAAHLEKMGLAWA